MAATVGSELVEKYAPDAPDVVKTRATEIVNAWVAQDVRGLARGRTPQVNALYRSGAAGILYPWMTPGVAGGTDEA